MKPKSSPRESSSQTGRAVLLLREMLLTGQFAAGDRVTELGLVEALGASRTPVRQALRKLAAEGLLEPISSRGFRVKGFVLDEVWDAIELRGVLEGTAARLAAERLEKSEELAAIRQHYDGMCALMPLTAERFPTYLELNDLFHAELRTLAKSQPVRTALENVIRLPFAASGALVFDGGAAGNIAQEHHRVIIEAIAVGAGSRAEHVAREHAQISRRLLEQALEHRESFSRIRGAALILLSEAV